MANYTNNPDRPNTAQGTGKVKPKSVKVNAPAPGSVPAKKFFDWGDGKGHSISLKDHKAHVDAKALQAYDIGGGYDPAQVRNTVNSAMDQEYGAPILNQQNQIATSQRRTDVDIPAWYQSYIDAIGQARQQTAGIYSAAAGASDVGAVAPTGDQTGDLAAANRAALQNSYSGLIKTQGANNETNLINQGTQASGMRIGSLQDEALNRQDLQSALGQLQKEKGDYGNTYLQKMREGAQTYDSDMAAASAAAAVAGQKIDFNNNGIADSVDAAGVAQDAQAKREENQITRWGYTNKEWRDMTQDSRDSVMKAQQQKGKKDAEKAPVYGVDYKKWAKMTPTQRRSAMKVWTEAGRGEKASGVSKTTARTNGNQWNSALSYLRTAKKKGVDLSKVSVSEIQSLAGGGNIPYDVATMALYWGTHDGTVSTDIAQQLKELGIKVSASHVVGG